MTYKKILLSVISFLLLIPGIICSKTEIKWSEYPDIPPGKSYAIQSGLAAPFAGSSNGVVLVAGGANFPEKPVTEGSKKIYHNDVFALFKDDNGNKIWKYVAEFPYRVAYGVSVTTSYGVICIGGSNSEGDTDRVTLMNWNNDTKKVEFVKLNSLPISLSNFSGDIINDKIYVTGGIHNGKVSKNFWEFDINGLSESYRGEWNKLPDMPGWGRVQPSVVIQNSGDYDKLYCFGGSHINKGEKPRVHSDFMVYDFSEEKWSEGGEMNVRQNIPFAMHGASALSMGAHHILFVGGVDKTIFQEALDREYLIKIAKSKGETHIVDSLKSIVIEYLKKPVEFYNFNKTLYSYHTITGEWTELSDYPYIAPAGAATVKYDEGFLVINGERKPGVRSKSVYFANLESGRSFGIVNYMVLIIYLLGMLYLGYFFMKRSKSTDDYFKAGGRIPWWAAGISIFATTLSAITFMSIPAKTYISDWRFFAMAISIFAVAPFIIKYYLPFIRNLNITSAYEYLEKRFNVQVRAVAAFLFAVFMVSRIAIVLFLPSIAMATVTGIDVYLCIVLMGVITIIYSTAGGVEAVVWGDVIQGFVLVGGALLSIVFMVINTDGGFSGVVNFAVESNKFNLIDASFDFSQPVLWVIFIGGFALNIITYASDQSIVQRYITTDTQKSAIKSIWMNAIIAIPVSVVFYFIGTSLFAFYKSNPSELNVVMQNSDAIFPEFIMGQLPVGVAGILIASIFSATMSTLSSNINSVATVFTTDFYQRFTENSNDKKSLRVAKFTSFVVGLSGIVLAIFLATWDIKSLFDHFNMILGLFSSGIGGLFVMGIVSKRISSIGAFTGVIVSVFVLLVFRFYTDIHFMMYGFVGLMSSIIAGYIVSLLYSEKKNVEELTV